MHPSSGKRPSCPLQLSRTLSQLPQHVHTAGVGVIDEIIRVFSEWAPYLHAIIVLRVSLCSEIFTPDTPGANSSRGRDAETTKTIRESLKYALKLVATFDIPVVGEVLKLAVTLVEFTEKLD
ncbi:hypothetical protein EXIGLDRAFT_693456, partial [Exidia glandulosa HHB12029]